MDSPAAIPASFHPTLSRWWLRARIAAAVGAGWWILHTFADRVLVPAGFERPLVLLAWELGYLGGLVATLVLVALAALGGALARTRTGSGPLLCLALLLACWATRGGTMDDWLSLQNVAPGPGVRGPYVALIPEYVVLLAAVIAAAALGGYTGEPVARRGADGFRRLLALDAAPRELSQGVTALLGGAAVAAVVLFIAAGPPVGHTLRGQIYFAAYVACYLGTLVAGRAVASRRATWYLPIPFVVGLLGLVLCSARPTLPPPMDQINNIPPWWGLGRPLPVEMVGVGVLGVMYGLVTLRRGDARHARPE